MEFIVIIISTLLAIIGTSLNTEKEKNKKYFKNPNKAGWLVIVMLLALFFIQIRKEFQNNIKEEKNRLSDKDKTEKILFLVKQSTKDSLNFDKQLGILRESYENQISVLTNTNNILIGTDVLLEQSKLINKQSVNSYNKINLIQKQDSINSDRNQSFSNELLNTIYTNNLIQKKQFDSTINNLIVLEKNLSKTSENTKRLTERIDLNDLRITVDLIVEFKKPNSLVDKIKIALDTINNYDYYDKDFSVALGAEYNQNEISGIILNNKIKSLFQENSNLQLSIYSKNNKNCPDFYNPWSALSDADVLSIFKIQSKRKELFYHARKNQFHLKLHTLKPEFFYQKIGTILSIEDLKKSTIHIGEDLGERYKKLKIVSIEKVDFILPSGEHITFRKEGNLELLPESRTTSYNNASFLKAE